MSSPRTHAELLCEIFERVVRTNPARAAIDLAPTRQRRERQIVTYAELDAAADAIAALLAPLVARRDEPIVAIALGRASHWVYAAQLAAWRVGAAFTCVDPSFPSEHVRAAVADAEACAFISDASGLARFASALGTTPRINVEAASTSVPSLRRATSPSALAYVIYTSGTTGAPKGVMIEHASIANLVRADAALFRLTPDDRVAQCSSPAYDSSLEETWLAFAAGATLVPLDDETVRLGPDLVPWLRAERVSVLCPPPTLLRTAACADPRRELPDLKLLYVGGEALPQDIADLWSDGRWLENGYGPTECTVTVVRGRMRRGVPVTIGRPVEGHHAYVVDEVLNEVTNGAEGELCLSGVGLARGYRNLPEVTAEKFVDHARFGRVYRTGDLVRRNADDELEYLGRIDAQVKLRGYRVELGAIDEVLSRHAGVREAACSVQSDGSRQVLVAHLVRSGSEPVPEFGELKSWVRGSLPEYMVPSRFGFLSALPRTTGGKLDRKALPQLDVASDERSRPFVAARDALEHAIAEAFAAATRSSGAVSIDDDFFLELGGDSLSAVAAICSLRAHPTTASVTVRDLYDARTVATLATTLANRGSAVATSTPVDSGVVQRSESARSRQTFLATLLQTSWLLAAFLVSSALTYGVAFGLLPISARAIGVAATILLTPLASVAALLVYAPSMILLTLVVKRVLIGRYRPGRIPVWSGAYVRHWIVEHTARLIPWSLLEGTIFLNFVLRALGAHVGRRVHIHRGVDLRRGGWDLLLIGDDVTLAQEASIQLYDLDDGHLVIGPATLGDGATIDVRASVDAFATVERGGYLSALSWLAPNTTLPKGERWDGVPARRVGDAPERPLIDESRGWSPVAHGFCMVGARCLQYLGWTLPIAAIALVAVVLGDDMTASAGWIEDLPLGLIALLTLAVVPCTLVVYALGLRVLGRVQPGTFGRWDFAYVAVWTKSAAVDAAGRWLSGTVFWPWWLRLAGMKIGPGCEISTIIDVVPETVTIGATSFFADGVYFCPPRVHRGTVTIGSTTLGSGTFLGNHALVPAGHVWPEKFFLGVSTVADAETARADSGWFGHPPMELPRREVVAGDRSVTHAPSLPRRVSRYFWESLRFALPLWPMLILWWWIDAVLLASRTFSPMFVALVLAPLASLAGAAVLLTSIIALKWLLLGRVQPGRHPLWSCWCSRWDFLYVAWGFWARGILGQLEGTVLLTWFLRAIGMRIGKGAVLGGGFAQVVDPDMLTIEAGATVTCNFQAHTFEDRILKIDRVRIGRNATVGHNAVVFYGANIGDNAHVAPHSVVMKGETLAAGGRYEGCPVALAPQPLLGHTSQR